MGKRPKEAEELDLVPIMNLVTILIPFLLMAAQFVSYAVIDSTLPAIGPPQPRDPTEKEALNLSVLITNQGWDVKGSAGTLKGEDDDGPTIPCLTPNCTYTAKKDKGEGPSEAYDVRALRDLLNKVKDEFAEEQNVILVPDSDVPYEVLVLTMDTTREDPDGATDDEVCKQQFKVEGRCLFPLVVIAGGVESAGEEE